MWFFALGIPAVILATISFCTLRDPPRGMSDPFPLGTTAPPSMLKVLKFLWSKKSVRHILFGGGFAAISMGALGAFFARFLVSSFHLGFARAGLLLGLMGGTAMASGLTLGGMGLDWASKFDKRWYVWGPALGLMLSVPLFILGVSQTTVFATILILSIAHVALFVYWTPTLAMAQNMVGANMRASSAFVVSLVLGLVGMGLGPTLVGFLSDEFAHRAFALGDFAAQCPGGEAIAGAGTALAHACMNASAAGVRYAIITMSLPLAWASLHYFLAGHRLRTDLDTHYTE